MTAMLFTNVSCKYNLRLCVTKRLHPVLLQLQGLKNRTIDGYDEELIIEPRCIVSLNWRFASWYLLLTPCR